MKSLNYVFRFSEHVWVCAMAYSTAYIPWNCERQGAIHPDEYIVICVQGQRQWYGQYGHGHTGF